MNIFMLNHDCSKCKLHRVYFKSITIESKDIDVYKVISTRTDNAMQSLKPDVFESIKNTVSYDDMVKHYEKAIDDLCDAFELDNEWWRVMLKKYNISKYAKIDPIAESFYMCLNDDNIPINVDHMIPKENVNLNY